MNEKRLNTKKKYTSKRWTPETKAVQAELFRQRMLTYHATRHAKAKADNATCPCPWCWKMVKVDFPNNTLKCYNCNRSKVFKSAAELERKCRILNNKHKYILTALDSNKNCPFCGSKSRLCFDDNWLWEIGCSGDGPFCNMQEFDTLEEAITAWNTRS